MAIKEKTINVPASKELSESFLEYSMSVVYSRAIPSIDGLKPVQRRILYGMWDAGWTNDKNYVKVSRIAGEIMGRLHPHGDSSISDALVKLAQPFYSNVPFVQPYGNFGDATGSPAAAARYIEGRLSKAAEFVLREIKENTVPMKPNYDGEQEEPVLLPIMFPVLLVNGNFGIGVGFSNKMPSHNLVEVINGTKALIRKPNASLDDIMKYIPGPDFPTGALIIGTDGIRQAYETGQGIIRLRARATIESAPRGKHQIIFTELPYGVSTANIISKIKDLLKNGKLTGLADAKDLTDRKSGLRVVIDTKAGVNPNVLLAELYKETQLEESFGINSTVLVNGEPRTVGLVEQIQLFIDFRQDVIRKRSEHRKAKKQERLHLLTGLVKALANIDQVIKIVRGAPDASAAQEGLMKKFKIDEIQADYVLSIPLRRLTKYDTLQLEDEKNRLEKEIEELDKILNDSEELKKVMLSELDEVKKVLGTERKSEIVGGSLAEHMEAVKEAVTSASVEVADEPTYLSVLASGAVVRSSEPYAVTGRGKLDPIVNSIETTTRSKVVFVTNKGQGYRVEVLHLSDGKNDAKAVGVPLGKGERIIAVAPDVEKDAEGVVGIAMATRKEPMVKIVAMDFPVRSDEFEVMPVGKDDEILSARYITKADEAEFVFITSDSSLLHFPADKVRAQGRTGGGVASMKVAPDAELLGFFVVTKDEFETATVLTVAGPNWKNTPLNSYPGKGRATGGVRSMKLLKGTTRLDTAFVGVDILAVDAGGKKVNLPAPDPRRDGSGVKIDGEKPVLFGRK